MNIHFYIHNRKPSKKTESVIFCYILESNHILTLSTKQRIKLEYWNKNFQRADPNLKGISNIVKGELKRINEVLDSYERKIKEIAANIRSKDSTSNFQVIADAIKKHYNKKDNGIYSVFDDFLKIKQHGRKNISEKSIYKFRRIKELLQQYEKIETEKLNFDKITPLFFEKFFSFLITEKNMLNNTAHKNISFLKTFLIWANNNNYCNNTSYKNFEAKWEANEIIFLNKNELDTLYNLKLEDERLSRVRDTFVFQCYTGARYSDIQKITREDIKGSVWHYRSQKTRQIIEVPLTAEAISILHKYSDQQKPLPIISNQKMNIYLKELCEMAGINEIIKVVKYQGNERKEELKKKYTCIGTHTARRSYVSIASELGVSPEVIQSITGHTTYAMMRKKYLGVSFDRKRNEIEKAFGTHLRKIVRTEN